MAKLTLIRDWGYLDLFAMPYFRDRSFPGRAGRLRSQLAVDADQARFESGARRWHPDFALRYSNSIGDWDFGVDHFYGTGREPSLGPGLNGGGDPVLIPEYELINQTGTDVQYTTGPWLWKLEALFRQGQKNRHGVEDNYYAFAGGFEYTFFGVFGGDADLGMLAEYLRDSRLDASPAAFQNDLFLGARVGFNDTQDTDLLAGVVADLSSSTRFFSVEAGRRLGESFRLTLEARLFAEVDGRDVLFDVRDDDYVQIEVGYFY